MTMGKHWIVVVALLALAACSEKEPAGQAPADDAAGPVAEAPGNAPGPAPATQDAVPEPPAVATNGALQAADVDAYLRGMRREVELLRGEYAKIEQARADGDSAAETAALFAMTANDIDDGGAEAAGLPVARYGFLKERIDEIGSKQSMLDGLAAMEGDTSLLRDQVGDPYAGVDTQVAEAYQAHRAEIEALRGEAIGLRLKAAGG